MARRDHRVGLKTTTISVKLTAPELEGLDGERKRTEGLFESFIVEGRGDALRRLIAEAAERRVEVKKKTDPRQVTLNEAIAATSRQTPFVCLSCDVGAEQWKGKCPSCSTWGSLVERETSRKTETPKKARPSRRRPVRSAGPTTRRSPASRQARIRG